MRGIIDDYNCRSKKQQWRALAASSKIEGCSASTTLAESDMGVDGGQSALLNKATRFCISSLSLINPNAGSLRLK